MRSISIMSSNYKFLVLFLFSFLSLKAQKTTNYFDYAFFPSAFHLNSDSRTEPINQNQYYWITENRNFNKIDSLVIVPHTTSKAKTYKVFNYTGKTTVVTGLMNKDSMLWNLLIAPTTLNGKNGDIKIMNSLISGSDLLLLCYISSDSLNIQFDNSKKSQINMPDSICYGLLKINQNGQCSLENYFIDNNFYSQVSPKIYWANSTKYTVYFPKYQGVAKPAYNLIPKSGQVADSQNTGYLMQFNFGDRAVKNWLSGALPISVSNCSSNKYALNDKILIAGIYFGISKAFYTFPFNPIYKLNNQPTTTVKRPFNFNRKYNYVYWMLINMNTWAVEETEYAIPTNNNNNPGVSDYGISKKGYWFAVTGFDSISTNSSNVQWQKLNIGNKLNYWSRIFTYLPLTKSITTNGFPAGINQVYSDGDSLIFISGDNTNLYPNDLYIDMDLSNERYPIKKGKFTAQFDLEGKLIWCRSDDIVSNIGFRTALFRSANSSRYLNLSTQEKTDMDYGFRYMKRVPILMANSVQGYFINLSKAPICDFDIENIDNNHVTINYKGALNANFYYKYGDGSKDSNMNQRFFVHDYKKTGSFILYCIAKNAFGSDTAYYAVEITNIAKVQKLHITNQIEISPNPSPGIVHWDIENTTSVDVFNLNGQLMQRTSTQSNNLDISMLPAQTYLVIVHTKTGSFCSKVVKVD